MLTEKGRRFDFEELRFEKSGFMKQIAEIPKAPKNALGKGDDWLALLEDNA